MNRKAKGSREMESISVRPWEVKAGDRILGMSCVANGPAQHQGYLYADAVGQQRYSLPVTFEDGRTANMPYLDDSRVRVIRPESGGSES